MKTLNKRLAALEGGSLFLTIGDMLDNLEGTPLDAMKQPHPGFVGWLESLRNEESRADS